MAWDKLRLTRKISPLIITYIAQQLARYIRSLIHARTYSPGPAPKNIVIIGGSFTGWQLAKRLTQTLPSGYRVVLIERTTHFNYTFNFPRYSVLKGREQKAFIPYGSWVESCVEGSVRVVNATVRGVGDGVVVLQNGEEIDFDFLALATGSTSTVPAKVDGVTKQDGRNELKGLQDQIEKAGKIAVVGGGAVGVQLVGDIKGWYPNKEVTLIQSRERLLPSFGERLGLYVVEKVTDMGIRVLLGERPAIPSTPSEKAELKFKNGDIKAFDLVIPCTGQKPNSSFLTESFPTSISEKNGRILVKPTLQLLDPKSPSDESNANIFALGDVAETNGAKMARAGMQQAEIVQANIVTLLKDRHAKLENYVPTYLEGSLKLSLGKDASVIYAEDGEESFLIPGKGLGEDLSVKQMWWFMGANLKDCDT